MSLLNCTEGYSASIALLERFSCSLPIAGDKHLARLDWIPCFVSGRSFRNFHQFDRNFSVNAALSVSEQVIQFYFTAFC